MHDTEDSRSNGKVIHKVAIVGRGHSHILQGLLDEYRTDDSRYAHAPSISDLFNEVLQDANSTEKNPQVGRAYYDPKSKTKRSR